MYLGIGIVGRSLFFLFVERVFFKLHNMMSLEFVETDRLLIFGIYVECLSLYEGSICGINCPYAIQATCHVIIGWAFWKKKEKKKSVSRELSSGRQITNSTAEKGQAGDLLPKFGKQIICLSLVDKQTVCFSMSHSICDINGTYSIKLHVTL